MSDSQVSVGAALGYAWSLWRTHWRAIWGALALNALAWTVFFAGMFTGASNITTAGSAGLLITTFPVLGAVMRLAFGPDHAGDPDFQLGALGLQWRRMELRLFAANLLLSLLMLLLLVICTGLASVVIGGIFTAKMAGHLPAPGAMTQDYVLKILGRQTFLVAGAIIQLVLGCVLIRLALYLPATAETGKVQLLKTWKLTRRRFWQIAVASLVIWLPSILIMALLGSESMSLDGRPAPLGPGETFIYSLICGVWAGAAAMPLAAGVQAYFYRNLKTGN